MTVGSNPAAYLVVRSYWVREWVYGESVPIDFWR